MVVVDQCPFKWDSFRDYTVDVSMSDDGKSLEVFTIEGEQRDQNSKFKANYSVLKKYAINIKQLQTALP